MVKVSISLPSNAQITVESQDQAELQEIVGMLRGLSRDLMHSSTETGTAANGATSQALDTEKSSSVDDSSSRNGNVETPAPQETAPAPVDGDNVVNQSGQTPVAEEVIQPPPGHPPESGTVGRAKAQQEARSAAAVNAFVQFCQSINPLGDMRKVVVAAEGAAQFLQMDSVDADDLASLFDRVGWLIPHSFTQTLRNAARSKFRWLERAPGRSGHYMVTILGRTTILGE